MSVKRVIRGISFLLTELGIFCAAASAGHVSPVEGIVFAPLGLALAVSGKIQTRASRRF
jgi:hypothetical protein